jgi:hypothetical protein
MFSGLDREWKRPMDRTEKEPRFRKKMFALIGALLMGYIGIKTWHVSVALDAYQGQVLDHSIVGVAK